MARDDLLKWPNSDPPEDWERERAARIRDRLKQIIHRCSVGDDRRLRPTGVFFCATAVHLRLVQRNSTLRIPRGKLPAAIITRIGLGEEHGYQKIY